MLIRQLQYFVSLARVKHFARAAEQCQVSQPALSAAIRKLEEELGVVLVRRGQRYEGLTDDGERLLERAQRLVADSEALRQSASLAKGSLTGQLHLGAIPTTMPIVPLLTEPFQLAHPQATVCVLSRSGEQILRDLDAFALDIGVTYLDEPTPPTHRQFPLYRERYALLMRDGRDFEGRERVRWDELSSLPMCLLTREMHNRRIIDATFARFGVTPKVMVETDTIFGVYGQVRCAGLYSVVPHSMLSLFELRQEVHALPIEPELSRAIGLVVRKEEPAPPVVSAALALMTPIDLQARFDQLISTLY